MLVVAWDVPPVQAVGTIYIRADGSIDPPTAPITTTDNVTYTFTDNILNHDSIIIERDNIVVDGGIYCTLQGTGLGQSRGIDLTARTNVTIRNAYITKFYCGIWLNGSSHTNITSNVLASNDYGLWLEEVTSDTSISGNHITANSNTGMVILNSLNTSVTGNTFETNNDGITLGYSSHTSLTGNDITANTWYGVWLGHSINTSISGNNLTANAYGIGLADFANHTRVSDNTITNSSLYGITLSDAFHTRLSSNTLTNNSNAGISLSASSNNSIIGNTITGTVRGIEVAGSSNYNNVSGNTFTGNAYGIWHYGSLNNRISDNTIMASSIEGIHLAYSFDNRIYHNNFIDNAQHVNETSNYPNAWDDGYPGGGNYWTGYTDADVYKGQHQNVTGSDGVWDQPYVINADNPDRYPLTTPFGGPAGDVDGDHDVDIFDIVKMAGAYSAKYPDARYDRQCDMDLDGDIDLFDIVKAAANFGESW